MYCVSYEITIGGVPSRLGRVLCKARDKDHALLNAYSLVCKSLSLIGHLYSASVRVLSVNLV